MTVEDLTGTADQLRAVMVAELRDQGYLRSPEVTAAFAKVAREHFAPGAALEQAYAVHGTVQTKKDQNGQSLSTISAPWLQARMIEDAQIRRGDRILEIGSGGCNAAYLAEMAGPEGPVVTVDIDPWVTERAGRFLRAAGYANVRVVTGDGAGAGDPYGPYDVIVVTAGAWDCPWAHLLVEGGRMVVPVIVGACTRVVTFTRHGDRWDGENPVICGFIPMGGAAAGYEQRIALDETVYLSVDEAPPLRHDALSQALNSAVTELWTGVTTSDFSGFFTASQHLAVADQRAATVWNKPGTSRLKTAVRWFTPALVEPDGFAYLTSRPAPGDEQRTELGVHGYGPRAAQLAHDLARHIQAWDAGPRHQPEPSCTLYPATADVPPPGHRESLPAPPCPDRGQLAGASPSVSKGVDHPRHAPGRCL